MVSIDAVYDSDGDSLPPLEEASLDDYIAGEAMGFSAEAVLAVFPQLDVGDATEIVREHDSLEEALNAAAELAESLELSQHRAGHASVLAAALSRINAASDAYEKGIDEAIDRRMHRRAARRAARASSRNQVRAAMPRSIRCHTCHLLPQPHHYMCSRSVRRRVELAAAWGSPQVA